jgi:hypothetical protein
MSIFDRIILTLYTIIMGVVAVLTIIVSVNAIPLNDLVAFATRVPGRWEYTVSGAVVLLVSCRLLFASWSRGGSNDLTFDNEREGEDPREPAGHGRLYLRLHQRCLRSLRLQDPGETAEGQPAQCADQRLHRAGINIPDTTDEVKRTVKKNIRNVVGVDVADVAVYFKHIKAKE